MRSVPKISGRITMSAIEAFDYEEPDWAALEEMYEDQLIAECTERAISS